MQIWENWYLRTDIYPQAAPIIARLPLGYAEGLKITVQVCPRAEYISVEVNHF